MEEIKLTEIEKIVESKNYSDLNKDELNLINLHFENEADYNNFKTIITSNLDNLNAFPEEIDTLIYQKINEKKKRKVIPIFLKSIKNIAIAAMLIISFSLGYFINLDNQKTNQIVEITDTKIDTFFIENNIFIRDTFIQNKIIVKERIVEVFIEKETEDLLISHKLNSQNFDSIPLTSQDYVENNSLDDLKDLSSFYTNF